MRSLNYLMVFMVMSCMPLCMANEECCESCPEEDHRAHVQLYFSGVTPKPEIEGPRSDYEWPGMNEDSFYDYFTK